MKIRAKRWMSALALVTGALGTTFLLRRRKQSGEKQRAPERHERGSADRWAHPGMSVTFRAQLMPGRSRAERTFRIAQILPSHRVMLEGVAGEHTENEFEPLEFQ
ncbi:MAG TPA: hypothetical protein VF666_13575 [Pyrinomonadaceae bacterium]|jgi:hypothetical protein